MGAVKVRGAREHNLQGVDLDLPGGALVVLAGVSGSGKSSLAFDTVHAEGRRRYLEALSAHVRRAAGVLRRPDVDLVTGLPPTIALEQGGGIPSSRATAGTFSEVQPVLRVLFARAGVQHCPGCEAELRPRTHDAIVAAILAHPPDTRLTLEAPVLLGDEGAGARVLEEVARSGFSRVRIDGRVHRLDEVRPEAVAGAASLRVVVDRLRLAPDRRGRLHDAVRTTARAGDGVVVAAFPDHEEVFTDRPWCLACRRALPDLQPEALSFLGAGACPSCQGRGVAESGGPCPSCGGSRLREEARAVRFAGRTLPEVGALSLEALRAELASWPCTPVTELPLAELRRRLEVLCEVGLNGLPLDRGLRDLSAGELSRLRLARQVGAGLAGVLYVLDEPTAGLGDDEARAVLGLLGRLRAMGNTLLVVEHHPAVIRAADLVYEFGPGAGRAGGRLIFSGAPEALLQADTPTGRWLSGHEALPPSSGRPATGTVRLRGVRHRNLDGLDLELPVGVLAAITGPSGTGKTTVLQVLREHLRARLGLVHGPLPEVREISGLQAFTRLVDVEQGSLGRTARSNPATYSGLWDVMRELLAATAEAQVRGMDPSFFSLATRGGRCEACQGTGLQRVDLGLLPDVFLPCEVCEGRRFAADVLQVRWKGHNAHELLSMSAEEARSVLAGHPRLESVLRVLVDTGLGYLPLGQPAPTLSGGEAQRLRLARELSRGRAGEGALYLVDDPTLGLHPADVAVLHRLLVRLVDEGATVWIATHQAALAEACDHRLSLQG